MRTYESSAKTLQEAIEAGLEALGVSISDVTVETLDEGSKGLFGLFGSRLAKVRLTVKEEEADPLADLLREETKPAPKPERKPRPEKKQAEKKPAEDAEGKPEKKAEKKAEKKTEKKPKAEKPAPKFGPGAEPAAEAADAAAEQAADKPAEKSAKLGKPVERKARAPKARAEKKPQEEKKPEDAGEKKPLPPKAPVQPLEKPEVTMLADDQIDAESPAGRAKAFLQELTRLMGVEVEIAMGTDAEGNVYAKMTGDTLGILIGRRGETLDALQYLTSLRVNRGQENYTRVTLDTENYRAKREDTLIRLANRMANRAVRTGRKVALEPMNPYERRIIHSALQVNEGVDTHSEGEEPNRHVVITVRK